METELNKIIEKANEDLKQLGVEVTKLQRYYWDAFNSLKKKGVSFDEELMKEWLEEFWVLYPSKNINEWFVAIPKFINFSIGWLDHTTKGYNHYLINQYTQWLGEVPEFIRKDLNIKEPEKIFVNDSTLIFPEGKEKEIEKQHGELLSAISKGTARIKEGKQFDILARIIESGALPFVPRSVDEKDLRLSEVKFSFDGKFVFQKQAYDMFLKYGALGIYWMTGAGKSFLTMMVLDTLKGNKALVVPTLTLVEQWKEYFQKYAPRLLNEVEIYTYMAYDKMKGKEWTIVVFDECHQLPADTFSRLATLKTKYRLGLSATPYREDGRTNYVFALTGYPVGLGWQDLMKILGKKYHQVTVYIVRDLQSKINLTSQLINKNEKTIIFVNLIDIGERISNLLGVPFIHGETKNRMDLARQSKIFVASRVLELGVSLKDLEHIIEVDFLFGSRREEVQRTGRLFHSEEAKKHDIIMTKDEFENYGKRLHGLREKGFFIQLRPMVSGIFELKPLEEKTIEISPTERIIKELFVTGFFKEPKKVLETWKEIVRRGTKPDQRTVKKYLLTMTKEGKMFNEKGRFVERMQ